MTATQAAAMRPARRDFAPAAASTGVRVELEGPATLAEAAGAGLLPPGLSERLEHLAGLRARLGERGAA